MEFKVVELEKEGKAFKQLKARKYWVKYSGKESVIYIVGIDFSKGKRTILGGEAEKII